MSTANTLLGDSVNEAAIVASNTLGVLTEHQDILVAITYALLWVVPLMGAFSSSLRVGKNLPKYFAKMPLTSVLMGVPGFVISTIAALMHVGAFMSVLYWWSDSFNHIAIFEKVTMMLYGPWSSLAMAFPVLEIAPIAALLSALVVQCASLCFTSAYSSVLEKHQKAEVSDLLTKFEQPRSGGLTPGQQITGGPAVLHVGKSRAPYPKK